MRKILAIIALLLATPAAAQNYQATQGAGTTFGSKLVTAVNYPQFVLCDPTTPSQCVGVNASGQMTIVGTGTFATQSAITAAAAAIANGASVAQGSTTDTPCTLPSSATACSQVAVEKAIANAVNSPVPAGTNIIGKVGIDQTTPGTTNAVSLQYGSTASVADPCQTATKVYTPINTVTANNTIIAGVSAKKKYICYIFIYPGAAVNFAVYQATTGTSCATAAADIFGGHTTATGFLATATAGFVAGNGAAAIAATNTVNTDICITNGGTVQLSGAVVTVDQ